MAAEVAKNSRFTFGVATRPTNGREANGDAYLIKQWNDRMLIALIDGLGHGEEAAAAANAAKEFVAGQFSLDVDRLMVGLHERLAKTRGAVIGLAQIDGAEKRFSFCGVGNIESRLISNPPMHPISREGIVGMGNLRLKKFEYRYNSLQALIMHSDGISAKFELPDIKQLIMQPQQIADETLKRWGSKFDDATIIIVVEEPENH